MNIETFIFTTDHKENVAVSSKLKEIFTKYKLQLFNPDSKIKAFEVTIKEINKK